MKETRAFILGALVLAILVLLCGCETAKQTQRRDEKAVARVVSKEPLLTRVAKHINTGGDTVKVVTQKVVHDTLTVVQPIYPQTCDECERFVASLVFATDHAIDTILPNGIRISITSAGIVATYTATQQREVIRDRAAERRWQDSSNAWQQRYVDAQGVVIAQREQNNILQRSMQAMQEQLQNTKKKIGWPWWVWTIIGVVAGALATATILQKAIPIVVVAKIIGIIVGLFKKKQQKK